MSCPSNLNKIIEIVRCIAINSVLLDVELTVTNRSKA